MNLKLVKKAIPHKSSNAPKTNNGKEGVIQHFARGPHTFGEKASDEIAKWAGSWIFILGFLVFLAAWMIFNTVMILFGKWDVYPFILLNLVLSCIAALQAPVILMSQNRQAQKDRIKAEYDYSVNRKAERGVEEIIKRLDRIERKVNFGDARKTAATVKAAKR